MHWWRSNYFTFKQYCKIIDIYNEELRTNFCNRNTHYIPVFEKGNFDQKDFLDICHMNESGTRKKAFVIADFISTHADTLF